MSDEKPTIVDVNPDSAAKTGFFCRMSKMKTEGNQRKLNWLQERFREGLRLKMFKLPNRGFIEYLPGEHAWRAVHAGGYMFIHCIWVVGRSKGKGLAGLLLTECIEDAQRCGMHGVATVATEGLWGPPTAFLEHHGFETMDQAPPSFSLMVRRFRDAPPPSFPSDWNERLAAFGSGLTVVRTDQCPYIEDATRHAIETVREFGIQCRVVGLADGAEVRQRSPSAYGVFGLVLDGRLLSYRYLLPREIPPLLLRAGYDRS